MAHAWHAWQASPFSARDLRFWKASLSSSVQKIVRVRVRVHFRGNVASEWPGRRSEFESKGSESLEVAVSFALGGSRISSALSSVSPDTPLIIEDSRALLRSVPFVVPSMESSK